MTTDSMQPETVTEAERLREDTQRDLLDTTNRWEYHRLGDLEDGKPVWKRCEK